MQAATIVGPLADEQTLPCSTTEGVSREAPLTRTLGHFLTWRAARTIRNVGREGHLKVVAAAVRVVVTAMPLGILVSMVPSSN
jgi:hypothetical protein